MDTIKFTFLALLSVIRRGKVKERRKMIYVIWEPNIAAIQTFFSLKFPDLIITETRVKWKKVKLSCIVTVSSVYHTIRLKYPYIDNCKHYPHGQLNHYADCLNQEMLKEKKMIFPGMLHAAKK